MTHIFRNHSRTYCFKPHVNFLNWWFLFYKNANSFTKIRCWDLFSYAEIEFNIKLIVLFIVQILKFFQDSPVSLSCGHRAWISKSWKGSLWDRSAFCLEGGDPTNFKTEEFPALATWQAPQQGLCHFRCIVLPLPVHCVDKPTLRAGEWLEHLKPPRHFRGGAQLQSKQNKRD